MNAKHSVRLTLAALVLACAAASGASAQGAREILSTFPDSQGVLFINSRRIFNEALPRVVPQAHLDKLFADAQKNSGFDVRTIHFVALGARFPEGVSAQRPPDFVVMVKGDFNVEGLLSLARMGAAEAHTSETYKGRTLDLFKTDKLNPKPPAAGEGDDPGKPQQPSRPPFPYPEVAAATFDSGTFVFGVPAYVRSAIDAAEGEQGRIRADLLELVTRNPDNLVSFVGDIPASAVDLLKSLGAPQNPELNRVVGSLRQVQFALQMNAADFGLQSIVRTDTAENARGLSGLITVGLGLARMGVEQGLSKVPATKPQEKEMLQTVLDVLGTVRNTAADNEVEVSLSVPQAKVAAFVAREIERRKAAPAKKQTTTTPRATPRRRTRRRN